MSFVGDTCTPIYQLPYATGASAPCNIDDTMCAFNDAVQEEIDRLQGVANRTSVTTPMVKVAMTVPTLYGPGVPSSLIVFDSALVDTDNMFTAAFPDQVTVNTPGVYGAYAFLYSTSTGAALLTTSSIHVDIAGAGGNFLFDSMPYTSGTPIYQSATGSWFVTTSGTAITMTYAPFIQGADVVTVQRAEMGLFWLCDLP
jgi:hypothetical protein